MRSLRSGLAIATAMIAVAASAQLLPQATGVVGQVDQLRRDVGGAVAGMVERTESAVQGLAQVRLSRLADLVRSHPADLEYDSHGNAAVRGEVILLDPDPKALATVTAAGFAVADDARVEGLDIRTVRLRVPASMSLRNAERKLAKLAAGAVIQSNPLYEQSGSVGTSGVGARVGGSDGRAAAIGLIDGGIAPHPTLPPVIQRGFARGAPYPGGHATAIASIMVGHGSIHGVASGANLYAADIYGRDPRGGNALAIVQAMGWLVQSGVAVINISLVGPDNPLLARAVAMADAKGVLMVAAVGNDGPAAPAAFPASYPQVIAVTGIDGKGRTLIEAGRAAHIDFAAPGADLIAASVGGGVGRVRGTSFAAPFVAGRLAVLVPQGRSSRAAAIVLLGGEAMKPRGANSANIYGRGIVCGNCATARK